jgi:DNA repair protein RecO (recombination protein O)
VVCRWFDLHLLDRSGFRPELRACAQCQKALAEETNAWSPEAGGAICASCAARLPFVDPLTVRALKSLRFLLVSGLEAASQLRIDPPLARELDRHLRGFLRFVLDRDIATARLLDELRELPRPQTV